MKSIASTDRRHQGMVLLAALLATFIPVAAIESGVLRYTGGTFMYPLDDTFIHMDIARNLAFERTWGITPGEYGAASSSLLYTVLLAVAFKLFSAHVLVPFIINCIAGAVLLFVVERWLARQSVGPVGRTVILLLVVFFTPLPILIVSGMEHTLQCLAVFLFLFSFAAWLKRMRLTGSDRWTLPWPVLLYGMLVCALRYEGLFLVGIAGLVLLYHKKWLPALLLGAVALLPLLLYGLYSVRQGGYFLPNSVLVKSDNVPLSAGGFAYYFSKVLIDKLTIVKTGITALATQRLLLILPLGYLLFQKSRQWSFYPMVLVILFFCTLLHLSFASTGWFYRYEAYLVLCAILALSVLVYKDGRALLADRIRHVKVITALLFFFLFFPLVLRSTAAFSKAGQACINIFEQQYQMGQFFRKYYNREAVAANDIGALSFLTAGSVVDLWGLGSNEVARSRKEGGWTPDFMDRFAQQKGARLAVVYDSWFDEALLQRWHKVATWQIRNNVICGDDTVTFYAIDPGMAPALRQSLEDHQPALPPAVTVRYY